MSEENMEIKSIMERAFEKGLTPEIQEAINERWEKHFKEATEKLTDSYEENWKGNVDKGVALMFHHLQHLTLELRTLETICARQQIWISELFSAINKEN